MEPLPQLVNMDDSPYETSSGPTTPGESPLLLPAASNGLDGKPLSHVFSSVEVDRLASRLNRSANLQAPVTLNPIRNVCFIGAGYVGMLFQLCQVHGH